MYMDKYGAVGMSKFMSYKVLDRSEQYVVKTVDEQGKIILDNGPVVTLPDGAEVRLGDVFRFYQDGPREFIMHTRPHNRTVDGTARLISYYADFEIE